jgi:hypothetical protein
MGNWLKLGDVAFWKNLVFSRGHTVIGSESDSVRLVSELGEVSSLSLCLCESESRSQVISDVPEICPSGSSKWSFRLLIHYYGDVHQPLHTSDRYTKDLPKGDKGGNAVPLKNHYSANELHAVWDNVIYTYYKNPKRPFTAATWADFGHIADDLRSRFTFTKAETQTADFAKFRDESYAIALTAYDGVTPGKD